MPKEKDTPTKRQDVFVVAPGRSICVGRIVLGQGDTVTANMFNRGQKDFDLHKSNGGIVKG